MASGDPSQSPEAEAGPGAAAAIAPGAGIGAEPPLSPLARVERGAGVVILCAMAVAPMVEALLRKTGLGGIVGVDSYLRQATLWAGFIGASLAAALGKHVTLATFANLLHGRARQVAKLLVGASSVAVTGALAYSGVLLVVAEREGASTLPGGLPVWALQTVIPITLTIIAWRLSRVAGGLLATAGAIVLGAALAFSPVVLPEAAHGPLYWLLGLGLAAVTLLGAPAFVALGGAALLLFNADEVPVAVVAANAYQVAANASLPTLPLFTLAGYILAEGGAPARLVRLFRGLFGWMPGGLAVATAVTCAFFTSFTGASGVTILALGGLLFPVLLKGGFPEKSALGLLTTSGSLGILFPPSLAVILYGMIAQVEISKLFIGGLIPGLLIVAVACAWAVWSGRGDAEVRVPFTWKEAAHAVWEAKWDLSLPAVVLTGLFTGWVTVVETAALTACYAYLVERVIHRTVKNRELFRAVGECLVLVGGVIIFLGVALGFTAYLVDAEVPVTMTEWVRGHISHQMLFLLALNGFLLLVGCLMDLFAIVVVVPLIAPMGAAFGVDPIHLGVIFVGNLSVGVLTPPVGMNLLLASFRFKKPLAEVYRAVWPYLIVTMAAVLVITYWPALTLAPLRWFGSE